MKRVKKFVYSMIVILLICVSIMPLPVYASDDIINSVIYNESVEMKSTDIIEYVYRTLDGKLQYRRWNRTKGVWVDPDWIDC